MSEYISIREQHCSNANCFLYGQKGRGNIAVHSKKERRVRCKVCKRTWVIHRDEVIYGLRSDSQKVHSAIFLLQEGMSIRNTARSVQVSVSTIQRWKHRVQKPTHEENAARAEYIDL